MIDEIRAIDKIIEREFNIGYPLNSYKEIEKKFVHISFSAYHVTENTKSMSLTELEHLREILHQTIGTLLIDIKFIVSKEGHNQIQLVLNI